MGNSGVFLVPAGFDMGLSHQKDARLQSGGKQKAAGNSSRIADRACGDRRSGKKRGRNGKKNYCNLPDGRIQ